MAATTKSDMRKPSGRKSSVPPGGVAAKLKALRQHAGYSQEAVGARPAITQREAARGVCRLVVDGESSPCKPTNGLDRGINRAQVQRAPLGVCRRHGAEPPGHIDAGCDPTILRMTGTYLYDH